VKLQISNPGNVVLLPGEWYALVTPSGDTVAVFRSLILAKAAFRDCEAPNTRLVSVIIPE
jgi:hypothetical protein